MSKFFLRTAAFIAAAAVSQACYPPPERVATSEPTPSSRAGSNQPSAPQPAAPPMPRGGAAPAGNLQYKVPAGWVEEQPSSSMRVAQMRLLKAEGDARDAELVVFHFGPGQGGSVQSNLDRWVDQMDQPDGSSSRDKAKTDTLKVNGLNATLLDVTGTFKSDMMSGGSGQPLPNARMRAAVIETPGGAYFIKLVGPEKTIARWDKEFMSFINSVGYKG